VFLVSGLWHGSQWNFVIWGALHGFYLVFAQIKTKYFKTIIPNIGGDIANIFITFVLVMLAWVFFRATSFGDAILIFKKIFNPMAYGQVYNYLNNAEIWFGFFVILLLLVKEKYWFEINTKSNANFYLIFSIIAFLSYLFGVFQAKQFIYFQF
jgi:alginate O-acetyltransferase complex protein AlgI